MTIETQYGYFIPELEDKDFWTNYNYNFTRLDQHDHDGLNSKSLDNGSFVAGGVTLKQKGINEIVTIDAVAKHKNETKHLEFIEGQVAKESSENSEMNKTQIDRNNQVNPRHKQIDKDIQNHIPHTTCA